MPLDVDLKIQRTELLYQESPFCGLTLKNSGPDTVEVANPRGRPYGVTLRIIERKTGIEVLRRKPLGRGRQPGYQPLAPGQSADVLFPLLDVAQRLVPGEYDISAIYDMKGGATAESKALTISVAPTTPRGLTLVSGSGGAASVLYGAWVNVGEPPTATRSRFEILRGGGVAGTWSIAECPLRARPVLSAPANRTISHTHWVAWMEDKTLRFTHFDGMLGALEVGSLELSVPAATLVEPLYTESVDDPSARPDGAALLVVSNPEGSRWQLQVARLTPTAAAVTTVATAGGQRPVWIKSHTCKDRSHLATYIQPSGENVTLSAAPWPKPGGMGVEGKQLAEWRGKLLAASARLESDDVIHGAAAVLSGPQPETRLDVYGWELTPAGDFRQDDPVRVPWDMQSEIDQMIVDVDKDLRPVALVKDTKGRWSLFRGEEKLELADEIATTKLPIGLAFLGMRTVLICGKLGSGFQVVQPDGKPLPPRRPI